MNSKGVMNWKGLFVLLGAVLAVFLIFHFIMQGALNNGKQKQSNLEVTLTQEEARNSGLHDELEQVGTTEYIIKNARENYAFVSRNELRFEYENPEALYAYTAEELQILMSEMAE